MSRSGGTTRAASRSMDALGKVTLPAKDTWHPSSTQRSAVSGPLPKQCMITALSEGACSASMASASASASRLWMTTGSPMSAASASWRAKAARCAGRAENSLK